MSDPVASRSDPGLPPCLHPGRNERQLVLRGDTGEIKLIETIRGRVPERPPETLSATTKPVSKKLGLSSLRRGSAGNTAAERSSTAEQTTSMFGFKKKHVPCRPHSTLTPPHLKSPTRPTPHPHSSSSHLTPPYSIPPPAHPTPPHPTPLHPHPIHPHPTPPRQADSGRSTESTPRSDVYSLPSEVASETPEPSPRTAGTPPPHPTAPTPTPTVHRGA